MTLKQMGNRLQVMAGVVIVFVFVGEILDLSVIRDEVTSWQATAAGSVLRIVILSCWAAAVIAVWLLALRYSWRRHRETGAPAWPFAVLIFTNFVGAVFYALFFARKHRYEGGR